MALLSLAPLLATCFLLSQAQIRVPLYRWSEKDEAAFLGMLRERENNSPASEEWEFKQDDPLNNYKMARYVGQIGIGAPSQNVSVVYDTSLQLLTVPSSSCRDEICLIRDSYDASKSSTAEKGDSSNQLTYCIAQMDGLVYKDTVKVSGESLPHQELLSVSTVQFGRPATITRAGLVGLGVTSLDNDPPTASIFSGLDLQDVFVNPVFTLQMERVIGAGEREEAGVIWFGNKSPDFSDDAMNSVDYIDVTEQGRWTIRMDYVVPGPPGDVGYQSWCPQGCHATLDSGSPYIVGPSDDIDAIHELIGAKQLGDTPLSKVDCEGIEDLPSIHFRIQGIAYVLRGKDYIDMFQDENGLLCLSVFRGDGQCTSDYDGWHLGQPFLQRHYTVFRLVDNGSVGFIPRAIYSD